MYNSRANATRSRSDNRLDTQSTGSSGYRRFISMINPMNIIYRRNSAGLGRRSSLGKQQITETRDESQSRGQGTQVYNKQPPRRFSRRSLLPSNILGSTYSTIVTRRRRRLGARRPMSFVPSKRSISAFLPTISSPSRQSFWAQAVLRPLNSVRSREALYTRRSREASYRSRSREPSYGGRSTIGGGSMSIDRSSHSYNLRPRQQTASDASLSAAVQRHILECQRGRSRKM